MSTLRPRLPLLLAALLYVLFRAWVLATNFDAVAVPVYEVPGMGNHAWLIVEGQRGVPWHYYYDNAGMQLLTGYLAVPMYWAFGASYLSLKLVPLLLGLGLMGLVWHFLRRNVGYSAAVVAVFAFALAPPTLSKYSMLAKGNHFEGLFFLFLPVVLFFDAQRKRAKGEGHVSGLLFAAGLASGVAVSVYFGSMLTLALLALVGLLFGVRSGVRDLRFVLPGAALGLVPMAIIQAGTGGRAMVFARRFTQVDPKESTESIVSEAKALLFETLPEGACFEPLGPVSGSVGEWIFMVVAAASWIVVSGWAILGRHARPNSRAAAALCALYLPLVLGVIAVGILKILPKNPPVEILGVRYLVSYYFYALLVIAIAIDVLLRRASHARWAGAARLAGAAMAAGLVATWLFVLPMGRADFSQARDTLAYPGHFLRNYGSLFQENDIYLDPVERVIHVNRESIASVVMGFTGEMRADVTFSLGNSMAYASSVGRGRIDLDWIFQGFPDAMHDDLARGIGCHRRPVFPIKGELKPGRRKEIERLLASPYGERIAEGLGMSLSYPLRRIVQHENARTEAVLRNLPERWREAARRGSLR